ncbi:MAG: DUF4256 domain-containing protein [Ignavibacteriae bacterium]|nr:DUF4256 domain-containing protein [Ignavibacteriota bacterium]
MTSTKQDTLITTLQQRFEKHPRRHEGLAWTDVFTRLKAAPAALQTLQRMEDSGGEPDVVSRDKKTGAVIFFDCSPESPAGRRSLCYDRAALEARKANKPAGNVMDVAAAIGIEILTEDQYRMLQTLGEFDLKTSSWILTPSAIRTRGGALFCDRRFDHVFTYHNGAESYYAARGFRGCLRV